MARARERRYGSRSDSRSEHRTAGQNAAPQPSPACPAPPQQSGDTCLCPARVPATPTHLRAGGERRACSEPGPRCPSTLPKHLRLAEEPVANPARRRSLEDGGFWATWALPRYSPHLLPFPPASLLRSILCSLARLACIASQRRCIQPPLPHRSSSHRRALSSSGSFVESPGGARWSVMRPEGGSSAYT